VIKYTEDKKLFQTERHSDDDFFYEIPMKTDGFYVLIAQFTEMYWNVPDKRKFNILLGKMKVKQNVDLVKEAGKFGAH